jgi:hypothetical protein
MMEQDRRQMDILGRIERGEISAAEGLQLIERLAEAAPAGEAPGGGAADESSILDRIACGEITAQDALRQLDAAPAALTAPETAGAFAGGTSAAPPPAPDIESWKRWWQIPLAAGVAVIVASSALMYSALVASGVGFWFLCATVPFALGVALAALAWGSRSSRWLHVRVKTGQASWPRSIAISVPIPIRLTAWALRTFRPDIPPLRGTSLDELILALESTSPGAPLYVDVDEGDGERVQVFIG